MSRPVAPAGIVAALVLQWLMPSAPALSTRMQQDTASAVGLWRTASSPAKALQSQPFSGAVKKAFGQAVTWKSSRSAGLPACSTSCVSMWLRTRFGGTTPAAKETSGSGSAPAAATARPSEPARTSPVSALCIMLPRVPGPALWNAASPHAAAGLRRTPPPNPCRCRVAENPASRPVAKAPTIRPHSATRVPNYQWRDHACRAVSFSGWPTQALCRSNSRRGMRELPLRLTGR